MRFGIMRRPAYILFKSNLYLLYIRSTERIAEQVKRNVVLTYYTHAIKTINKLARGNIVSP